MKISFFSRRGYWPNGRDVTIQSSRSKRRIQKLEKKSSQSWVAGDGLGRVWRVLKIRSRRRSDNNSKGNKNPQVVNFLVREPDGNRDPLFLLLLFRFFCSKKGGRLEEEEEEQKPLPLAVDQNITHTCHTVTPRQIEFEFIDRKDYIQREYRVVADPYQKSIFLSLSLSNP